MKRLLASCFGLGWLPVAPGTWGSLPPTVILALTSYLNLSPTSVCLVMVLLILAGSIICVVCAPATIAATGKADPPEVAVDEFAGQALTYLIFDFQFLIFNWQSTIVNQNFLTTIGGFLLFRFFDIAKPWPIRKLEKLPQGWGVLADDLLAGVYAGITLLLFLRLYAHWSVG
jgi:phosphatidylglycerophosphatase A